MSSVFEMDEFEPTRQIDVKTEDIIVEFENADISWGFKVKQNAVEAGDAKKNVKTAVKVELETESKTIVEGVSLKMQSGDFLCVVGQVGCGKSTFLHAIMEENTVSNGKYKVNGSIAYVEQEPFIFSATVRENIMLG